MELQGLPGIANDRVITCLLIKKGSDIEVILDNYYAATAAGSNGAINVWTDDDWATRCEAQRYQRTLESKKYTNVKSAIKWVDKWLPKIK